MYFSQSTKRVHSALIHLTRIPQLVANLSDLSADLIDSVGSGWSEVWSAWQFSSIYAVTDSDYVDLREFARQIQNRPNLNSAIRDDAEALEASVDAAVLLEREYPDLNESGGISIYSPWNHDDFDSLAYAPLDFAETDWPSFISIFTRTYLGDYAATLYITSNIQGAKVFLNGVDTGYETNAVVEGVYPRMYALRLVKAGYQHDPDPRIITVGPRENLYVHVPLYPSP